MNWKFLRFAPWLDTRASFVAAVPHGGTLLDIGASDGETLGHMAELRPDLQLFATDIEGKPQAYPAGCRFHRGDVQKEKLPWADALFDAITCMQLVEHLQDCGPLMTEAARLLKPGGKIYIETPHPKSLEVPSIPGSGFTLNFYDDKTHVRVLPAEELKQLAQSAGLHVECSGKSRNWLFAALHPLFALFPPSRKKYTAYIHWLGWSTFLIAIQPAKTGLKRSSQTLAAVPFLCVLCALLRLS